jgi:hypothetical protein
VFSLLFGCPGLDLGLRSVHKRVADGRSRKQGRAQRDSGDQDRNTDNGVVDPRQGDSSSRRSRPVTGLPPREHVCRDPHSSLRRRAGRGAQERSGEKRAPPPGSRTRSTMRPSRGFIDCYVPTVGAFVPVAPPCAPLRSMKTASERRGCADVR